MISTTKASASVEKVCKFIICMMKGENRFILDFFLQLVLRSLVENQILNNLAISTVCNNVHTQLNTGCVSPQCEWMWEAGGAGLEDPFLKECDGIMYRILSVWQDNFRRPTNEKDKKIIP